MKKYAKKKAKITIESDMPMGRLIRIKDFLPPPGQLGEIGEELSDQKVLKLVREGRRAVRRRSRGILLSDSLRNRRIK